MEALGEILVGVAILVGLVGIVLPILPGLLLEVGAILVWAFMEGGTLAWSIGVGAVLLALAGQVVKYAIPGRRLKEAGIPRRTLYVAGLLAIVGFFVIPVLGLFVGFVGGTYLAERQRLGAAHAWPSTMASMRAAALAIGIELVAGLLIAGTWLIAAVWLT